MVLVIARSASAVTGDSTVSVLLSGSGSGVEDVALALFVTLAPSYPEASLTLSATIVCPIGRSPSSQRTVRPLTVQPFDAELTVSPAGTVSVTTTARAVDGPAFVTRIV